MGDIFQRGNEEIECLELLKNSGSICLKGNCDLYHEHGVDIDPDVEYLREYYDGMRKKISDVQMEFMWPKRYAKIITVEQAIKLLKSEITL